MKPELLYLDLMKKILSYSLWPELLREITTSNCGGSIVSKSLVSTMSKILASKDLKLSKSFNQPESLRHEGRIWPVCADTMIGLKRLDNLQYCIETVLDEKVQGDLIETGVWRGGSCIFMRAVLAAYDIKYRTVFVADSFEGLPRPDLRYLADKDSKLHTSSELAVSLETVKDNFKKYGLLDEQVHFLKGWFKDTLPKAPIFSLSVLRLDGDMYGSTMDSLVNLYHKLSHGGFCIVDDYYAIPACKLAVDDFRSGYKITEEIKTVDWSCVYWRKK